MTTVVVVDDETLNADALAFFLAAEGLTVKTAADGEAGLRLIAEVRPDVVITDFMMPVLTGLELAQKLRADVNTAHIPLILLTAAQAEIGRRNPDLFNVVFEKPSFPSDILAAVHRLVDDKRKR